MNLTLRNRIAARLGPLGCSEKVIDAATEAALSDIKLLNIGMNKSIDLLGTYPVKPGAQEIYDSVNLLRQQYIVVASR